MTKKPLQDLHVLVIRPKPQGEILCEKIREMGGQVSYFPTIEINLPDDIAGFKLKISALDQYDWLIFVSPQAVYASAATIHSLWPTFPKKVNVAAVGAGTAKVLKEAKLPVHIFPKDDWSSEGLLGLSPFQRVRQKKIAIIRGESGRELLSATLTARGAQVIAAIAYRRTLPQVKVNGYLDLLRDNKVGIIVGTSYEAIQNLKILVGERDWILLREVPLLVVSERIATLAKELGFVKIFIAKNASHNAIIEGLINCRRM